MKKIAIVTGGNSNESVISVRSAAVIFKHIDKTIYDPYMVELFGDSWNLVMNDHKFPIDKNDFSATVNGKKITFDAIYLIMHGTPGEDGILQAYFDLLNLPYTSCGRVASTITFSKNITQIYAKHFGAITAASVMVSKDKKYNEEEILAHVGLPCFVKPNNGGSSIGVSKVSSPEQLAPAIAKALLEDNEVQIEEFIEGTEVTCGVLQNGSQVITLPITEITTTCEFFDFEAKYDGKGTKEITPARISKSVEDKCNYYTLDLFKKFNCKGVCRIDYIIKDGEPYFLEINTIPGMSEASIIPQQAAHAGMSLTELITILLNNIIK